MLEERIATARRELAGWKRAVWTYTDAAAIEKRNRMVERRELELAKMIDQKRKLEEQPQLL